jgi:hypothetical protein
MSNDQRSPLDTAIPLVGWGSYADLKNQIMSRTFGHMVRLAAPVVKEYHSDLFIDALNLEANLDLGLNAVETGTSLYYAVRHSGTWMGDMAVTAATSNHGDPTFRLYHLSIGCDERQAWSITITDETDSIRDTVRDLRR